MGRKIRTVTIYDGKNKATYALKDGKSILIRFNDKEVEPLAVLVNKKIDNRNKYENN